MSMFSVHFLLELFLFFISGLSLSLLQANEELLSDDPEASDEEAETEAMDTHSEYDYPLPSTGELNSYA